MSAVGLDGALAGVELDTIKAELARRTEKEGRGTFNSDSGGSWSRLLRPK